MQRLSRTAFSVFFALVTSFVFGQTCISQGSGGNWGNSSTWLCDGTARIPQCGDTIQIQSGDEVTVTSQYDFSACGSTMAIDVAGTLTFTNGNKVRLPCGSLLSVQTGGLVCKSGGGGGSSTLISICGTNIWTAGDGPLSGPVSYGGFILPIELFSFDVEATQESTIFKWTTATETNNDYFSIYHSLDGENWVLIDEEYGAGTSNFETDCELVVDRVFPEGSLFRLDQTDFDGTTASVGISELTSTINLDLSSELELYPNPTDGVSQLYLRSDANASIRVYDIQGREMGSWNSRGEARLILDPISIGAQSGIYIVTVSNGNQTESLRWVVR